MSRLRAAGPSAARTRARWALWTLIGINALMLWFFLGMSASLDWHARVLEENTLQQCASQALQGPSGPSYAQDLRDARFVGDVTVRFTGDVTRYDQGSRAIVEPVEIECRVKVADGDSNASDGLLVERAEVVR